MVPLLRHGLRELLWEVQKDRLQVASGLSWDEDGHLPRGWKPFNSLRWLGNWLKEHNPKRQGSEGHGGIDSRKATIAEAFTHLDDGRGYALASKL